MLQKLTEVRIADNTGVILARVIQVFGGRKTYAALGNLVRLTTRTIRKLGRIKKVKSGRGKKIIFRKRRRMSSIVRLRRDTVHPDSAVISFKNNAVVLYRKRKVLKGKRFKGVVSRRLGYEKLIKKFRMCI